MAREAGSKALVLVAVAAGGMVGASLRLLIDRTIPHVTGSFPWAIFWVNLSGSLALGFLVVVLERFPGSRHLFGFLASGLVGSYTTMSTYLVETSRLAVHGHELAAVVYVLGSLVGGVALAWGGMILARATQPKT